MLLLIQCFKDVKMHAKSMDKVKLVTDVLHCSYPGALLAGA